MNASLESLPVTTRHSVSTAVVPAANSLVALATDITVRDGVFEIPGEMSLHHVRLVHGSPPNTSDDRRIGFAIRYIPTSVSQIAGTDSATLVRGTDRHHHFELEPRPSRDLDPELVALHKQITERNAQILYRGTDVKSYNDPRAVGLR